MNKFAGIDEHIIWTTLNFTWHIFLVLHVFASLEPEATEVKLLAAFKTFNKQMSASHVLRIQLLYSANVVSSDQRHFFLHT